MISPIALGTIEAIIDCHGHDQCHHRDVQKRSWNKSSFNALRRAVAINLGTTRRPHQQMQQRHYEDIVSIATILIPQLQSSSKEHQLPQRKCDKRNQEPGGPLNRKPQADWAYSCLSTPATRTLRSTTKHAVKNLKKTIKNTAMWHLCHASRAQH